MGEETVVVTGMEALWTTITSVITNFVKLLSTVTTSLLSNELFGIVIGIVMFSIGMGVVFTLVNKVRKRGK